MLQCNLLCILESVFFILTVTPKLSSLLSFFFSCFSYQLLYIRSPVSCIIMFSDDQEICLTKLAHPWNALSSIRSYVKEHILFMLSASNRAKREKGILHNRKCPRMTELFQWYGREQRYICVVLNHCTTCW